MKKIKKVFAVLLVIVFSLALVQVPMLTKAADGTDTVYVKIRLNRQDNNYEGWNLWVWETGGSGSKVDFTNKDSDGVFAVIETKKSKEKLNYIIRKSVGNNDWAEKFVDGDQSVDLSKGSIEVYANDKTGTNQIEERDFKKSFDSVTVKYHYNRYNNDYDNWDLYTWGPGVNGGNTFKDDEYGKVATVTYSNVQSTDDIGFIVRQGGDSWTAKDVDSDRFINKIFIDADGNVDVYLIQGDSNVYYSSITSNITSAKIDSINKLSFSVNTSVDANTINDKLSLKNTDGKVEIKSIEVNSDNRGGIITTTNNLDLTKNYILNIEGFPQKSVAFGDVYDSKEFADLFTYNGDLGSLYSKDKTKFVVWAPTATDVKVALYGKEGKDLSSAVQKTVQMVKGQNGEWTATESGDLNGCYYNYLVSVNGTTNEVVDPYAKAVGVNGQRAMVIDLDSTNPEGWENDVKPSLNDPTDAVIYELHVRDLTSSKTSGASIEMRGKFNGIWQPNTTIPGTNVKTGVDHLVELGVNVVHLLPSFDYASVDEANSSDQFNWGYDPQNYNALEGSYSSDPYTAEVRVKEFKKMIQELHKRGIRVVMDVVYNHTYSTNSNFNGVVPDYYYRLNKDGSYSNGSGCGNETASDRSMYRKFMIDSVTYYASEYHVDGFRFDLMAVHDQDTMVQIRKSLDKIDKTILMYGEGWTGGESTLASDKQASKANMPNFGELQIAAFSDNMRDGIKGHVFTDTGKAFVNGGQGFEDTIKFGIVAATKNDQIDSSKVQFDQSSGWANEPYQCINYASAHDNLTLYDKLQTTNPEASKEELVAMNKMSAAIVYTSQGIPFMQAGEEMARTKVNADGTLNENSYNAPDSVNQIDWNRKVEYNDLFEYYKGLISLRKSHKLFRLNSTSDINSNLKFLNVEDTNVVAYTLDNNSSVNDDWNNIAVIFNANDTETKVTLPSNDWVVVVNEKNAGTAALSVVEGNTVTVPSKASYVLVDKASYLINGNLDNLNKVEQGNNNIKVDNNSTNNVSNASSTKTKTSDFLRVIEVLAVASLSVVAAYEASRKMKNI